MFFEPPVAVVYNPLGYAWDLHRVYLERYVGEGRGRVLLLGMNPGPWGMAQTGVPFGDVEFVRDWLDLSGRIRRPEPEHPKIPVAGLDCHRREVSGQRLWGWARDRFVTPQAFFERFLVLNYCPLSFMEAGGRNRTPDKLPRRERDPLFAACDRALRDTVEVLAPSALVGIGRFAEARLRRVSDGVGVTIGSVLHPSPASPAANRGWAEQMDAGLRALGVTRGS